MKNKMLLWLVLCFWWCYCVLLFLLFGVCWCFLCFWYCLLIFDIVYGFLSFFCVDCINFLWKILILEDFWAVLFFSVSFRCQGWPGYYRPKRALNRQVLILCTKRSRSVSDITSMQSVVRNQYRLVLRKWNDEMVSEIPSHPPVNMHFWL